jgi:hypothetical protein
VQRSLGWNAKSQFTLRALALRWTNCAVLEPGLLQPARQFPAYCGGVVVLMAGISWSSPGAVAGGGVRAMALGF